MLDTTRLQNALETLVSREFHGVQVRIIDKGADFYIAFYETNPASQRFIQHNPIMVNGGNEMRLTTEWELNNSSRKWVCTIPYRNFHELIWDLERGFSEGNYRVYDIYEKFRYAWLHNLAEVKVAPIRETVTIVVEPPKKPSLLKRLVKALDKITTPPVETIGYVYPKTGDTTK